MLDAGRKDQRIRLQRHSTDTGAWTDLATTPVMWARVEHLGEERYRITANYRADLFGFKDTAPTMRLLWRDRVMDIADVSMSDERNQEIIILAAGRQIETEDLARGARRTQAWPS
jgi:head-tail adaptor